MRVEAVVSCNILHTLAPDACATYDPDFATAQEIQQEGAPVPAPSPEIGWAHILTALYIGI